MLHEGRDLKRTRIGATLLCEALLRQGVDVFFSYPGGVILPLYDILGDYPELRHVLVRHEQGGAHAADGYARVTGRVGVCMGTSGPGATNLVTGIGTSLLDSVPIVAITGNVPAALIGKDAFQEIDINGITLPMTKHNYLVRNADDLPRVVAEAFHIARSGRPGPVHIDITKDALQQETRAGHPTEAEVIAGLPGFRPQRRAARPPAEARGVGDREREATGHPRRPRRASRRGVGRARRLRREGPDPGRLDAAWDRRHRRDASARLRLHGHARLEARQPGDPVGRPPHRDRDALRRPRDRQRPDVRAVRADRACRHRPRGDRKNVAVEVPIVGDAKRVLQGLTRMVEPVDPATAGGLLRAACRVEGRFGGLQLARLGRLA
jgi:acetolactate synthase-1/2/3 large subunit